MAQVKTFRPPRTISRRDYLRAGSDEWFREAIYTTVRALGALLACREAFGRSIGLTASQFAVLMGTGYRQKETGVSIRDLARHLASASTHVTTEVGRLVRKGYLVKRPSTRDRRSILVSLSPRGRRTIKAVAPLVRRTNDALFAGIRVGELDRVRAVMRRVAENAESTAQRRDRARRRRPRRDGGE